MGTLPPFASSCLCDSHQNGAQGLEAVSAVVCGSAPVRAAQPASNPRVCTGTAPTSSALEGRKRLGIHCLKQIFSIQISYSGVVNPLVMGLEYITALRLEPDREVGGIWIQLKIPSHVVLPTGSVVFGWNNGATLWPKGSLFGRVSFGARFACAGGRNTKNK